MLVIDVESRPNKDLEELYLENLKAPGNIKDPEKVKGWLKAKKDSLKKDMALDPDYNEIICIGIKDIDGPEEGEIIDLKDLSSVLKGEHYLVTFNGKAFDLPTIIKNGRRQGIELPYEKLWDASKRYPKKVKHYDLQDLNDMRNGFKYLSLEQYARIYLGKDMKHKDIDFDTATEDQVKVHCLEDCYTTYELFNKFRVLYGL